MLADTKKVRSIVKSLGIKSNYSYTDKTSRKNDEVRTVTYLVNDEVFHRELISKRIEKELADIGCDNRVNYTKSNFINYIRIKASFVK